MPSHTSDKSVWFGYSIQNASDKRIGEKGREREEGREGDVGWQRCLRWTLEGCQGLQCPASSTREIESEGEGKKRREGKVAGGYQMAKMKPAEPRV